jgi:AraC-like DNA-binding protein
MDRLSPFFARFPPVFDLLFSGHLKDTLTFERNSWSGFLYWIEEGSLSVESENDPSAKISSPCVLFFPRAIRHRIVPDPGGAKLIATNYEFGQRFSNPLTAIEDDFIVMPINDFDELKEISKLIFKEVFLGRCGFRYGTAQLSQYFLLSLFRELIKSEAVLQGVTKALADPFLLKAMTLMHQSPERPWTVESLANEAGMSRARFAKRFKEATGSTPLDYLTAWRISVVKSQLKRGRSLKSIAQEVGYESASALTRVFTKREGQNPMKWIDLTETPQKD